MRDLPSRRFRWRVALPTPDPIANRMMGLRPAASAVEPEEPGPDGIRHGLVARVKAQIAAGVYDTEEKWLAAEEALLARVGGG